MDGPSLWTSECLGDVATATKGEDAEISENVKAHLEDLQVLDILPLGVEDLFDDFPTWIERDCSRRLVVALLLGEEDAALVEEIEELCDGRQDLDIPPRGARQCSEQYA